MPATVYPSQRLFSDVTVIVSSIRIDGDELPEYHVDPEGREVALHASGRKEWREAELLVRVEAPVQELKGKGLDDKATHALVRINCNKTNLRSGELVALKNGVAELRLAMRPEHVVDRALLECFIIRDTDEGFARILREAEPWVLALVEPRAYPSINRPSRPGGLREFVQIEWQDFTDPQVLNGSLSTFAREAYFFDVESDPPTLYLNRGIEGYHALLNPEGATSGSQAENIFRELEYKRLSLGVWLTLCFEALSCLIEGENGEIIPLERWRGEVLKLILPRVFPGESIDAAYRKIIALRGNSGTSGYLLGKLQVAVNEHISTSTTLKKHLMALLRQGSA